MRVWNTTRTQAQIQNAMFSRLAPPLFSLVMLFTFDEASPGPYSNAVPNSPFPLATVSGSGVSTASLAPLAPAPPPSGLVVSIGYTAANISWTPPAVVSPVIGVKGYSSSTIASAPTQFLLTYSTNMGTLMSILVPSSLTSTVVTNLVQGSIYNFDISSFNVQGYGISSGKAVSTLLCPRGYFCFNFTAFPCTAGKYNQNTGASSNDACLSCFQGQFCPPNATVPLPCLPGFFCSSTAVQAPCVEGDFSVGSATVCESCSPGTFSGTTGSSVCPFCGLGKFSNSSRSSACFTCTAGRFSSNYGVTVCQECPAGSFCVSGATTPTPCPPGSRCPAQSSFAIPCSPGSFSGSANSIVCDVCGSGYVASTPGSLTCSICVAGKYSANSTSSSSCISCYSGTYSDQGLSACKVCSAGYFCVTGSPLQQICPAGTYCPPAIGEPMPCSAGRYNSAPGANQCLECPAGSACPGNSSHSNACSSGRFSPAGAAFCSVCEPGTFSPSFGQSRCLVCAAGYSCAGNGTITPTVCSVGSFSQSGATSCSSQFCSNGQYAVGNLVLPAELRLSCAEDVFVVASYTLPSCATIPGQPYSFAWTSSSAPTLASILPSLALTQASLFIPARQLPCSAVPYMLTVSVSPPASFLPPGSTVLSFIVNASTKVILLPRAIVLRAGGDQTLAAFSNLVLDASFSFDPDVQMDPLLSSRAPSLLNFQWSGVGNIFNGSRWLVSSSNFNPGSLYTFTLTVRSPGSGKSANTTISIQVAVGPSLSISILPLLTQVFALSQPLRLQSFVTNLPSNNFISYTWRETGQNVSLMSTSVAPLGFQSPYLLINPSGFLPSLPYVFQVSAFQLSSDNQVALSNCEFAFIFNFKTIYVFSRFWRKVVHLSLSLFPAHPAAVPAMHSFPILLALPMLFWVHMSRCLVKDGPHYHRRCNTCGVQLLCIWMKQPRAPCLNVP